MQRRRRRQQQQQKINRFRQAKQQHCTDLSQFRIPDFHHQRFQNLDQKPAMARLLSLLILREQWVW